MTREQTKKMILYLHMAYRDFCGDKDLTSVVNIWHDAFKDYDVKIVEIAAKNYVKTNEFAPTIAGIMKQIRQISKTETETDLWALIQKAASNGIYNSAEELRCRERIQSASYYGSTFSIAGISIKRLCERFNTALQLLQRHADGTCQRFCRSRSRSKRKTDCKHAAELCNAVTVCGLLL